MKIAKIIFTLCATISCTLNCMDQEPPQKSPKMALGFLLNPSSTAVPVAARTRRLYTCPACGAIIMRRLALEEHMTIAHGTWTCPEPGCSYQATALRSLTHHIRSIHYHEVPGSCPLCSLSAFIRTFLSSNICAYHKTH